MRELLETIKLAALEAVETQQPATVLLGTVEQISPLTVRVHQRLKLGGGQLLFLAGTETPAAGTQLALLRFPGGQQFLVLGEIRH